MKRLLAFAAAALLALPAAAQKYSTYYYQRASLFEVLPAGRHDIIFVGNSITDGGEWSELFGNRHIKNRGISGDISEGVLDRIDVIAAGRPSKIFMMIGTNDLARDITVDEVVGNTRKIIERIHEKSPSTLVYIQSILPVTPHYGKFEGHTSRSAEIREANSRLQNLTRELGATYIDLWTPMTDPATGLFDTRLTNDGLHLTGDGYLLWREIAEPYVRESKAAYRRRINANR